MKQIEAELSLGVTPPEPRLPVALRESRRSARVQACACVGATRHISPCVTPCSQGTIMKLLVSEAIELHVVKISDASLGRTEWSFLPSDFCPSNYHVVMLSQIRQPLLRNKTLKKFRFGSFEKSRNENLNFPLI